MQCGNDLFLRHTAQQRGHVLEVDVSPLRKGQPQRVLRCVRLGNSHMGADGALGEDIAFALYILLIVQFFQRQQQRITCIFGKGKAVAITADISVLFYKAVIEPVQLALQFMQPIIITALCLLFDQLPHSIADPDHGAGAFFRCFIECRGNILPCHVEKQLAILDKITIFCDLLLCGLRIL